HNQIESVSLEELLQVHCGVAMSQCSGTHLDVAEAKVSQFREVEIQRLHMIQRKRETETRQRGKARFAFGAGALHVFLRKLEDDLIGEVAIATHELEKWREELRIDHRVAGNVAEDADVALLLRQTAHNLYAAEEEQVVDNRHQALRRGELDVLGRHDDRSVFAAQARQRLIEAQLALRQADDRLEIEIDATLFE